MAQKDKLGGGVVVADAEPSSRSRKRSKSRSPTRASNQDTSPPPPPPYQEKPESSRNDVDPGVKDNDIFLLPSSDYSLMILLTCIAVAVRLFRIYQPSSVVFDEVQ